MPINKDSTINSNTILNKLFQNLSGWTDAGLDWRYKGVINIKSGQIQVLPITT